LLTFNVFIHGSNYHAIASYKFWVGEGQCKRIPNIIISFVFPYRKV